MNVNGVELYEPGDMVCQAYRREGKFEPAVMAEWLDNLAPGKLALDIGAYSGLYAIAAAQRGFKAVAWEPNREMVARIRKNMKLNQVTEEDITIVPHAAGARDRQGFLVSRFPTSSASRVEHSIEYSRKHPLIEIFRAGSHKSTYGKDISVVKIDVEGTEIDVLDGLAGHLDHGRPVFIVEANTDQAASELSKWFVGTGYRHEWLDNRNLVFRPCA